MKKVITKFTVSLPMWTIVWPLAAWVIFVIGALVHWPPFLLIAGVALISSVLCSVHHAEVIAHRIGEPFGTVVLALSITIIEVSLIVSLMLAGGPETSVLARDTVFAAVMIILNGMVGLSILAGGIKFKEQNFTLQGISAALTILVAIASLTLILPNYTTSVPGPYYSRPQLIFVSIVTLVLYGSFLFVQNIRHKTYFLSPLETADLARERPSKITAIASLVLLVVCLGAVVLLAELLAPGLKHLIKSIGAPVSLSGVIIAFIVLLPEGIAAVGAARNNQLQKSFNLSLGSALASIGLTIPAVAMISLYTDLSLTMGIDIKSTVLFLLSLFVLVLSLSTGKTSILQGIVLLVLFAVYLFTIVFP